MNKNCEFWVPTIPPSSEFRVPRLPPRKKERQIKGGELRVPKWRAPSSEVASSEVASSESEVAISDSMVNTEKERKTDQRWRAPSSELRLGGRHRERKKERKKDRWRVRIHWFGFSNLNRYIKLLPL
jgi:hypothetical protein